MLLLKYLVVQLNVILRNLKLTQEVIEHCQPAPREREAQQRVYATQKTA